MSRSIINTATAGLFAALLIGSMALLNVTAARAADTTTATPQAQTQTATRQGQPVYGPGMYGNGYGCPGMYGSFSNTSARGAGYGPHHNGQRGGYGPGSMMGNW